MSHPYGLDAIRLFVGDIEVLVRDISINTRAPGYNLGVGSMGLIREFTVHGILTDEMIEASRNKVSADEAVKGLEAIRDELA